MTGPPGPGPLQPDARPPRLGAVRALWGALLIVEPDLVLALAPRRARHDPLARVVLRVLGARHLLQAAVVARWPLPWVRRAGAAVDAAHAGTDLALAGRSTLWRRNALLDAAVTGGFAVGSVRLVG